MPTRRTTLAEEMDAYLHEHCMVLEHGPKGSGDVVYIADAAKAFAEFLTIGKGLGEYRLDSGPMTAGELGNVDRPRKEAKAREAALVTALQAFMKAWGTDDATSPTKAARKRRAALWQQAESALRRAKEGT